MTDPSEKLLYGFIYEPDFTNDSPFDGFTIFPDIKSLVENQPEKTGRQILKVEFKIKSMETAPVN